jgi:hypothetical protein
VRVFFFFFLPSKRFEDDHQKADHPISLRAQVASARAIPFRRMLPTIHFHDKALLKAAEIHDVSPDRPLPPELMPFQPPPPQLPPQRLFRVRRAPPKRGRMLADRAADDTHGDADNKKKTLIPAFSRKREKEQAGTLHLPPLLPAGEGWGEGLLVPA